MHTPWPAGWAARTPPPPHPAGWLGPPARPQVDVGGSYPRMFNIYFYDGAHTREAQKQAIVHAWPALTDACIIVVDDW